MLVDLLEELDVHISVQGIGTMFQIFFTEKPVRNYRDALTCNTELHRRFSAYMREEGIFLAPSQYETNFISLAHSKRRSGIYHPCVRKRVRTALRLDVDTPGY